MNIALSVVFSGLLIGSVYALLAAGVTILYGSIWLPNATNGQFFLLSGLLAWWIAMKTNIDPLILVPLVILLCIPIYWLIERFLLRRFYENSERGFIYLFMTLGIAQILSGIFSNTFGLMTDSFQLQTKLTSLIKIGTFSTTLIRLLVLILALTIVIALVLFLRLHKVGRALRAVFQDREATEIKGVNVHQLYKYAYIIGSAIVSAAGVLYILAYPVDLSLGWTLNVLAFAMIIVGGPGSVLGCMAVGLIFGFTRAIVTLFASPITANFSFYVIMLLILLLKPMGLFRR
jgi:branched-chain amino acid transport system permease protein